MRDPSRGRAMAHGNGGRLFPPSFPRKRCVYISRTAFPKHPLPPCGGGLGWGVGSASADQNDSVLHRLHCREYGHPHPGPYGVDTSFAAPRAKKREKSPQIRDFLALHSYRPHYSTPVGQAIDRTLLFEMCPCHSPGPPPSKRGPHGPQGEGEESKQRQLPRYVHPLTRKRESRAEGSSLALDSRFRGNDGRKKQRQHASCNRPAVRGVMP